MKGPRLRLIVTGALFGLWTVWLGWQAFTTSKVLVVSRPQLFVADIVVEADVPDGPNAERQITVIHTFKGQLPANQPITVTDLGKAHGWQGPQSYILALRSSNGNYALVATPVSPGFRPMLGSDQDAAAIYPATESTRAQVRMALGGG